MTAIELVQACHDSITNDNIIKIAARLALDTDQPEEFISNMKEQIDCGAGRMVEKLIGHELTVKINEYEF